VMFDRTSLFAARYYAVMIDNTLDDAYGRGMSTIFTQLTNITWCWEVRPPSAGPFESAGLYSFVGGQLYRIVRF